MVFPLSFCCLSHNRQKLGHSFPLLFRMSGEERIPGGRTIDESRVVARMMEKAGIRVLVVGGGMVGCEVADFLGEHLHRVTLVEMLPEVAQDVPPQVRYLLLQRLKEYDVQIKTGTKLIELLEDGGVGSESDGKSKLTGFDTIVLALGTMSVNHLKEQLTGKIPELYNIGDAVAPRQAIQAIEEGARVGVKI